jgi:outer membrane lipoprotein carrier protein
MMLMRFLGGTFCAALLATPSTSFAQEAQSGVEQLRQFVRNSKTAEGEFVQQQLRAPKPNEPQYKG